MYIVAKLVLENSWKTLKNTNLTLYDLQIWRKATVVFELNNDHLKALAS